MTIQIEKPAYFPSPRRKWPVWPWLASLALHGLLLLLVAAFVQAGINVPTIQVSLLAPEDDAGQTQPADMAASYLPVAPTQPTQPLPASNQPRQTTGQMKPQLNSGPASQPARGGEGLSPTQAVAATATSQSIASQLPANNLPPAKPGMQGAYEMGQVDKPPMLIRRIEPVYPQAARRRNIEGWVEIRFLVDQQGQVRQEKVVQAQPHGIFENSALTALRGWQFSPGRLQGQAVDTWMMQVVRFQLKAG